MGGHSQGVACTKRLRYEVFGELQATIEALLSHIQMTNKTVCLAWCVAEATGEAVLADLQALVEDLDWQQQLHQVYAVPPHCHTSWSFAMHPHNNLGNQLHVQGVMDCSIFNTAAGCTTLRDLLKGYLNVTGSDGAKITVKACTDGRTATYMLGYIQKDKVKAHYDMSLTAAFVVLPC
ncbi:TPA: hypothetical protein ACH3X1_015508 [Trebouxia sp. C0004]